MAFLVIEKIAYRDAIGDVLAEGIERFHEELGVKNWTVKGLEFAAHEGRVLHGQGLSYVVSNRCADYMYSSTLSPEYNGVVDSGGLSDEKTEFLIERENHTAIRDSGTVCAFFSSNINNETLAALLDTDYEHLQAIGGKIVELERHFNNQRGKNREDDRLPYDLPEFEDALETYYALRGWTDNGIVPGVQTGDEPTASY